MAETFPFALVAPARELFAGQARQVDAPGSEGDFGVLAGHAPFMTLLRAGVVRVHTDAGQTAFRVPGGFADVSPEGFVILAESAEPAP
jgi:F-type H+-transporting ATPase subunit epsilon